MIEMRGSIEDIYLGLELIRLDDEYESTRNVQAQG